MDRKFAIFDMDGTLVDSMGRWQHLAAEFLGQRGVTQDLSDVLRQIRPLTVLESAQVFIDTFSLSETPEQVAIGMERLMDHHYRTDIPLKAGILPYLDALEAQGIRMGVASATPEPLIQDCLERLGIAERFSFLLSCDSVGVGKRQPDVFLEAARRLGSSLEETTVYEDALHAIRTATGAGFYTVGIYDQGSAAHWPEIQSLAQESYPDWGAALAALKAQEHHPNN